MASKTRSWGLGVVLGGLSGAVFAGPPLPEDPPAPFYFHESTNIGLRPYEMAEGMGSGVAAADFDRDGDIDFFVPTAGDKPQQLYRNRGDGVFDEIAAEVGLGARSSARCALWFDGDGDGWLDLLIANDDPDAPSTYQLFRQRHDQRFFDDVTTPAGFCIPLPDPVDPLPRFRGGMAAGDLNGDGWLDVVTCMWNGHVQVFANDNGTGFIDVTEVTGIETSVPFSHQPLLFDVNNDGLLDVYIAVDFRWNALYINEGNGRFTDIAEVAGADSAWNEMGMTLGDYDRDGDFDIYVTNITAPGTYNILLQNDTAHGRVKFTERAYDLDIHDGGWGWGTTFFDADRDGWLDLVATNGWQTGPHVKDQTRFFWNRGRDDTGAIRFAEVATETGVDDREWGSALIAFDADGDLDLDLFQTCNGGPLRLLRNEPSRNPVESHALLVRPRMRRGANHYAIGAVVRITAGGARQQRLIGTGTSYMGQEPAEAFFGVGVATEIDQVEILWPDGRWSILGPMPADQILHVDERDAFWPERGRGLPSHIAVPAD